MKNELFTFNLLPPKSKEEILVIEERDNTLLYSLFLVFFGMILFFALTMLDLVFIEPNLINSKQKVTNNQNVITQFNNVKAINGELFTKSRSLSPILANDIETLKFINKTAEIVSIDSNIKVLQYSREDTGEFVLTMIIDEYANSQAIIDKAKQTAAVQDVYVRRLNHNVSLDKYEMVLAFNLEQE